MIELAGKGQTCFVWETKYSQKFSFSKGKELQKCQWHELRQERRICHIFRKIKRAENDNKNDA